MQEDGSAFGVILDFIEDKVEVKEFGCQTSDKAVSIEVKEESVRQPEQIQREREESDKQPEQIKLTKTENQTKKEPNDEEMVAQTKPYHLQELDNPNYVEKN